MSERKKPYYIGVDIGVASCGVACCDENYNILKYNGKDCLVSRIFDRADDCKHRRALRGARRLVERRKKRIFLLQEIFRSEIYRKDPNFYERLEKSQLYCDHSANDNQNEKDKIERLGKYTLFNDEDYTDLDYHKDFPTIYHLRQALYDKNNLKHAKATGDIRLVYLACEHIIKKRGNFLIDDEMDINQHSIDISMKIKELNGVTEQMTELGDLSEKLSVSLELRDLENREIEKKDPKYWLINIIKNKRIGITILKQFGLVLDDPINFLEEGWQNEIENQNVKYYFEKIAELSDFWQWYHYLKNVNVSKFFIEQFDKHNTDKKDLKEWIKTNKTNNEYNEIFIGDAGAYCKFVGRNEKCEKVKKIVKDKKGKEIPPYENLMKKLDEIGYIEYRLKMKNIELLEKNKPLDIFKQDDKNRFFLAPLSYINAVLALPHQFHFNELVKILDNVKAKFSFLNQNDDGYANIEKVKEILKFRMPYWAGITNNSGAPSLNSSEKDRRKMWMEKSENNCKILPWNWEKVINSEQTAENFIHRMLNYCTYLVDKPVLPKESLIYQKYLCLSQLNKFRLKNTSISQDQKEYLWKNLYLKGTKITPEKIIETLNSADDTIHYEEDDINFCLRNKKDSDKKESVAYLSSINKLKPLFNNNIDEIWKNEKMCEDIIKISTILPTSKMKYEKITQKYLQLKGMEKLINVLNFSGWGRLSDELLTNTLVTKNKSGEIKSVLKWMEDTTENFMKLMSSEFDLKQKINEHSEHYYALQNYTTPSDFFNSLKIPIPAFLQRSVRQCCHCIDEYIQLVGGGTLPKKIFIETTREDNSKAERDKINKKVNKSRFENLEKLLNDNQELKEELNNYQLHLTEEKFYLYFLQQGKDLYTMEPLSINKLRLYEVDHIIPQSLTLDNSLDNKVLTTHPFNHSENKTDIYPFSHLIKDEVKEFWKKLKSLGFLNSKKYNNLARVKDITTEEKEKFLKRDLVQTGWEVELLRKYFDRNQKYHGIEIILNKPHNVSYIRHEFKIPKLRGIDNTHHAIDAYLNIVTADVINKNFPFLKEFWYKKKEKELENGDNIVKRSIREKIATNDFKALRSRYKDVEYNVKKNIKSAKIYTTYMTKTKAKDGSFFKQNLLEKSDSDSSIMKKKELVCKKYGGYESYISYFYVCVSQGKKIKSIKLLSVPYIYLANIKISDYLREPQEYLKKIPEKYLDKYDEIIFPFIPQGSIFKEKDGIEYFLNGKASNGFRKTKTKISFNFESNDEEIKSNINKVLCGQWVSEKSIDDICKRLLDECINSKYYERIYKFYNSKNDSIKNKRDFITEIWKFFGIKYDRVKIPTEIAFTSSLLIKSDFTLCNYSYTGLKCKEVNLYTETK